MRSPSGNEYFFSAIHVSQSDRIEITLTVLRQRPPEHGPQVGVHSSSVNGEGMRNVPQRGLTRVRSSIFTQGKIP